MVAERTILAAAKLIAPVIEVAFAVGFDWCVEQVKDSQYSELSNELEVTKGLTYLKQKDIVKVCHNYTMTTLVHQLAELKCRNCIIICSTHYAILHNSKIVLHIIETVNIAQAVLNCAWTCATINCKLFVQ